MSDLFTAPSLWPIIAVLKSDCMYFDIVSAHKTGRIRHELFWLKSDMFGCQELVSVEMSNIHY